MNERTNERLVPILTRLRSTAEASTTTEVLTVAESFVPSLLQLLSDRLHRSSTTANMAVITAALGILVSTCLCEARRVESSVAISRKDRRLSCAWLDVSACNEGVMALMAAHSSGAISGGAGGGVFGVLIELLTFNPSDRSFTELALNVINNLTARRYAATAAAVFSHLQWSSGISRADWLTHERVSDVNRQASRP